MIEEFSWNSIVQYFNLTELKAHLLVIPRKNILKSNSSDFIMQTDIKYKPNIEV